MKIRNSFVANSSSEVFIITTNRSLEIIKQDLEKILDIYDSITGENKKFSDIFQEPIYASQKDKQNLRYYRSMIKLSPKQIVVYSKKDNSIPYGIIEFIEETYNCDRIHLG